MDQDPDGTRLQHDRTRDEQLVQRWRAGDERAFGELYDAWFDRVHDLATRMVRDGARAADVTQDTFLAAWQRIDSLADPAAFGGWLLRICRNRALNVLEKEGRAAVVDDRAFLAIEAQGSPVSAPDGFRVAGVLADHDDPARAVGEREVAALLWEAAEALGERDRTVLDLQLRHGLTPAEIGEVVGVNRNAANQLVHRVKQRLEGAVTARLLWRGEAPTCPRLLAELETAGVSAFDQRAIAIANRHAPTCDECEDRQRAGLEPVALFGALPIALAPALLKQQTASVLEGAGVSMGGSAYAPAGVAGGPTGSEASGPSPTPGGGAGGGDGTTPLASAGAAGPTAAITRAQTRDSDEDSGSGGDGGPNAPRRTALVVAAILALLALVGGTVLAVSGDDNSDELATEPTAPNDLVTPTDPDGSTPSTASAEPVVGTAADAIGHPTTTTTPALGPTATTEPGLVVPPPAPTTTTSPPAPTTTSTTSPPPATASASISPATAPPTFPMIAGQPILTWSTSGGASVEVTGPGFSASTASGSAPICPGTIVSSLCVSSPGSYTYRVRVRNSSGVVVATDAANLVIA